MTSSDSRRRGVVAVILQDARFLLIRRSQYVEAPGYYCFPGGGIEAGESELQALHREMREELDCSVTEVRRLYNTRTAWGVDLTWWLCELEEGASLRPDPQEVESVHWLTREELEQLPDLLDGNLEFLQACDDLGR